MKKICDKAQCSGCGLCVARCPKHCITMKEGNLGHLYPKINQDICVDCGLCKKGCPALHDISSCYPLKAYAAWSKDSDDYISSTSGGVASVFTNYILSNGGVVYGCAVLPEINISHIRVNCLSEAVRLKGSKYVQSSIVDVMPHISQDIKNGLTVLFIGTPCQVAAIKSMYKEQPDNLYLVDIICHGTPSNKWLSNYIIKDLKIKKEDVTNIRFRYPNSYSIGVYKDDQLLYKSKNLWIQRYEDLYYNTFIDGFTFRDSCFNCHYAKPERISDITIGDFWGLGKEIDDKYIPEHKNGISCILPITQKGKDLVCLVNENLNIYERPVSEAVNGNSQLKHASRKNWRIKCFSLCCRFASVSFSYKLVMCDKIIKYKIKKAYFK